MLRLRLPHQHFSFTHHRIAAIDDPAVALAYASSLRYHTASSFERNATSELIYVDAAALRLKLAAAEPIPEASLPAHGGGAGGGGSRVLPVFVFSIASELPALVDKDHQAVALEDMVIAVQSQHRAHPSAIHCGNAPMMADLRSALGPTLAATAQLLGGILPAQSRHEGHVASDWRWSVRAAAATTAVAPAHSRLT